MAGKKLVDGKDTREAKRGHRKDSRPNKDSAPARPVIDEKEREARRKERAALKKAASIEADKWSKKYIAQLKSRLLQPSRKHYGGQGYAKESIFLDISDPQYASKFEGIWDEHVPGFSGKSFKKRRTDSDMGMLWRKRVEDKSNGGTSDSVEDLISKLSAPKKSGSKASKSGLTDVPSLQGKMVGQKDSRLGQARKRGRGRGQTAAEKDAQPKQKQAKAKKTQEVVADAAALQQQAIAAYRKLKASKTTARK